VGNPRAWSQELSAHAALSFGAGLVAYGSAIDKRIWPSGASTILIAIGVGAVITGFQLLRALPQERIRPPYWLRALVILAPLVAGTAVILALAPTLRSTIDRIALRDRDLEGLTIAVPEGNEIPNPQRSATLTIMEIAGLELAAGLIWQIGTFDDDTARDMVGAGARNAQASAPVPLPSTTLIVGADIPHRLFRVVSESAEIFITIFPCGRRVFGVFTGGEGALQLLRRMTASVRCSADPRAVPRVPAIVDLPDDWKPADAEPGQLAYTRDSETLVVVVADVIADGALQGAMESSVRRIGANARLDARRDVVTPSGTRPVWTGAVTIDDTTVPLHLSALTCPDQRVTLIIEHFGGSDETTTELVGRVRCADTPPGVPTKK
jgi:hypothetical protein